MTWLIIGRTRTLMSLQHFQKEKKFESLASAILVTLQVTKKDAEHLNLHKYLDIALLHCYPLLSTLNILLFLFKQQMKSYPTLQYLKFLCNFGPILWRHV